MSSKKPLIALVGLGILLAGITTPAMAHDTQTVDGYDITFGGAEEPLITGERMWLDNVRGNCVCDPSTGIVSESKL